MIIDRIFQWWDRWSMRKRNIFVHRFGSIVRHYDPLVVANKLAELQPDWESLLAMVGTETPKGLGAEMTAAAQKAKDTATSRLVEISREAFGLPGLDDKGGGYAMAEVLGVLIQYIGFMGRLAKAAGPFSSAGHTVSMAAA